MIVVSFFSSFVFLFGDTLTYHNIIFGVMPCPIICRTVTYIDQSTRQQTIWTLTWPPY